MKVCQVFIAAFFLSGCSIFWGNPGAMEKLTPEQIQAYRERGFDVYSCFTISGPPPSGRGTNVFLPRRENQPPMPLTFGPDCLPR